MKKQYNETEIQFQNRRKFSGQDRESYSDNQDRENYLDEELEDAILLKQFKKNYPPNHIDKP